MMYVTHHLEEMFEIGDRVTVLRDGGLVTSRPMSDFDQDALIALDGRAARSSRCTRRLNRTIGEPRLMSAGCSRQGAQKPIDFEVRAGEIVGIAGLLGSGRSELLRAIFGADPVEGGHIEIDGKRVPLRRRAPGRAGRPRAADRGPQARSGCCSSCRSARTRRSPTSTRSRASGSSTRSASAASSTSTWAACELRAGSWEQPVSSLSGGNQQKVLLARWLATKAKVLMFDEPTKGVDVGAKAEIYKVIGDLAAEGLGVVVVSSYLPEVLGLADRVLVMREGTVAGELPAEGATEEDVLHIASGGSAKS